MAPTATELVDSYVSAASRNDFETMRSFMADDLHFEGPIDTFERADDLIEALRKLSQMKTGMQVDRVVADGPDVFVWYTLSTAIADPAPVVEWHHVEDGRITQLRVIFDARPFQPPA